MPKNAKNTLKLTGAAAAHQAKVDRYMAEFPGERAAWVSQEIQAGRIVGDARGFAVVPLDVGESLDAFWAAAMTKGVLCP